MIQSARTELKLDKTFGCAPKDYWMSRAAYPSNDSIFTLLEEKVLTDVVRDESREDKPRLAIINTGAIRFDICEGPFTRDSTFIVFPFTSGFRYLKNGPTEQAYKLLSISNNGGQILDKMSSDLQSRHRSRPPFVLILQKRHQLLLTDSNAFLFRQT